MTLLAQAIGLTVFLLALPAWGKAGWTPAPCVYHMDHDDDHRGYFYSAQLYKLKAGVTPDAAATAVDNYLFEVSKRDDLVVFFGFFDAAQQTYALVGTWRNESGAVASYNFATAQSGGNFLTSLTETAFYNGLVTNFQENEEVHSAIETGLITTLRVAALNQPALDNSTSMVPRIESELLPKLDATHAPGLIDYTVLFPTLPTANKFLLAQATYANATIVPSRLAALNAFYNTTWPNSLTTNALYQGVILNFWHSAPGTTAGTCTKSAAATIANPANPLLVLLTAALVLATAFCAAA